MGKTGGPLSKRVCPEPGCPTLTNGGPCQQHRRESPTYLVRDKAERNRRALTVAAWVAEHGWTCPGWQRPAHHSRDLTAAHTIAVALGGARSPLTVLCRSCNSAQGIEPTR